MTKPPPSPIAACCAAAAALAVAMGIGRFAFTPMLPLMIRDGHLTLGDSPWLAAANYLGYFVGALTLRRVPMAPGGAARLSLIGIVIVTAAMGWANHWLVWLALRAMAGILSGWALVGVSAWALHVLAVAGRPHWAGLVYAGVGCGIAIAGLTCLWAGGPGVSAARLWLDLGGLALAGSVAPLIILRHGPPRPAAIATAARPTAHTAARTAANERLLALCYGLFGFGYILPATYLPALARQMMDDPHLFGLVWPGFGAAAAVSLALAARPALQRHRLTAWALCHLAMALGAALPAWVVSPATLGASAVLIGGTFMIVTMLGMQEARHRAPDHPAAAMGRMTAAFALGQLAGPLALLALPAGSLRLGLGAAALGLLVGAAALGRMAWGGRQPS